MSNFNYNAGYGKGLVDFVRTIVPTLGNILVVMNVANIDESNYHHNQEIFVPDADSLVRFYTTVATAYAAAESNNNDVILIDANSSHSNAMITVSKNRIHFIGMDGGGRKNSQGAKLVTPVASVAASVAVIKNTGTRNSYRNLKIIQNGASSSQTSAFIDTGEGTYMENCGLEVNASLSTVTQALWFAGDTCHYKDCQIGNSTVTHTAQTQAPLTIKKYSGAYARYSYFENCSIVQYTSQTNAPCIQTTETDGFIGWIHFKNCSLISAKKGDGGTAGGAMAVAAVTVTTSGYLLFDNRCTCYNSALFSENDAYIIHAGAAAAGSSDDLGGVATPMNNS